MVWIPIFIGILTANHPVFRFHYFSWFLLVSHVLMNDEIFHLLCWLIGWVHFNPSPKPSIVPAISKGSQIPPFGLIKVISNIQRPQPKLYHLWPEHPENPLWQLVRGVVCGEGLMMADDSRGAHVSTQPIHEATGDFGIANRGKTWQSG